MPKSSREGHEGKSLDNTILQKAPVERSRISPRQKLGENTPSEYSKKFVGVEGGVKSHRSGATRVRDYFLALNGYRGGDRDSRGRLEEGA